MSQLLQHKLLRNLEMGSPEWFAAQHQILAEKPAVERCYRIWYDLLLRDLDSVSAEYQSRAAIEIGSGSSFLREVRPGIITSDVVPGDVDLVVDGRDLPFATGSVRALFLTHVFHHIPDVERFLREADRVLTPTGVISIVDETHTRFARFFFGSIHPEPYDDRATEWRFPPGNTMLHSNQALSWMVFFRDRGKLHKVAPNLSLERWQYLPWFSYLMSGGVNLKSLVPRALPGPFIALDRRLKPLDRFFAIHWHLTIRKRAQ